MTLDQRMTIPDEVVAQDVGGETVLLHLASGRYFCLNAIGGRIWQLLEKGGTLRETCDTLLEEYDVPRHELERDVLDLVASLADQDLVVVE